MAKEQRDDPSAKDDAVVVNNLRQPQFVGPPTPQQMSSPPYRSPQQPYTRGQPQHPYNYRPQGYEPQQQPLAQPFEPVRPDSRNYTDSQLGVRPSPASQPLFHGTARPNNSNSTPRNRHAPLSDRGSVENRSLDGDASHEFASASSVNPVVSPAKRMVGSSSNPNSQTTSSKNKAAARAVKQKDMKSGRVTPVRDHVDVSSKHIDVMCLIFTFISSHESTVAIYPKPQRMFHTPSNRREVSTSTPNSAYSEPQRKSNNSRSPRPSATSNNNMHNMTRSPDYHKSGRSPATPCNTPYFKNSAQQQQQQSKLPHGLTVKELKEMTRARLAAEANYEGDSIHSGGTGDGQDRNSPDQYPLPPSTSGQGNAYMQYRKSSADGISISSGASNGNLNGYAQQQGQVPHPHQRMQVQSTQPPAGHPIQYPYPCHPTSPAYQQQRHRTDTWDNPSLASTSASDYHGGNPSFSPPASMSFNRGRCFSAGATTSAPMQSSGVPNAYEPSSWEEDQRSTQQEMYRGTPQNPSNASMFHDPALTDEVNRRRCATMSPPGMSRLHEDRNFLFSGDEKQQLAIPPLSEPRPRFNTTGLMGSAFEPILNVAGGMRQRGDGHVPPSPPSLVDRVKFSVDDRMMSVGSNGDLPSSVAEAVLESLTASSGPIDLFDSSSPFRSSGTDGLPFRKSSSNDQQDSLDRMVTESSGSGSLFSSGPSQKSVFSSNYDRMLSATNSWGGEVSVGEENSSWFGFSQEFNNLLIGNDGPALRGRAQTAPDRAFISQLDPEHNFEETGSRHESAPVMPGFGRSTNLPPGFDKPTRFG